VASLPIIPTNRQFKVLPDMFASPFITLAALPPGILQQVGCNAGATGEWHLHAMPGVLWFEKPWPW
jgi:hypothetical protein